MVILAGFTDWLDGFIARTFGARSTGGLLLDAAADKLFALSVLLTLVATGALALWEMALVIARDLAVVFVAAYVALRHRWPAFRRLVPRVSGKVATGCQFALFLAMTLTVAGEGVRQVALWLTVACSLVAAGEYLVRFAQALAQDRREGRRRGD
jgi:CDP-diacylglycerol--glycerol-3-phosphate 3-phosphatidyltransferase/cardiolipin synthase